MIASIACASSRWAPHCSPARSFPPFVRAQTFSVARAAIGGDGGTDYLAADTATGRVYVSRGTHVMVIDGATAKVLADIGDTPRVHGVALRAARRPRLHDQRGRLDVHDVRPQVDGADQEGPRRQGWPGRHHVRRRLRQDPHDRSQPARRHRGRDRPEERRRRGDDRSHRPRTRGRRERRQGSHLHQHRGQERDRRRRREDVEGRRDVADRAVRRADRHRARPRDESHLLRLQRHVGRRRCHHGQGRREARERRRRGRTRLGRRREAHLHPRGARRHGHRRTTRIHPISTRASRR